MRNHQHGHIFMLTARREGEVAGDFPAIAGFEPDGAHLTHLLRVDGFASAADF